MMLKTSAVQSKPFSLAGLFSIPDIEKCYSAKKLAENLSKTDIHQPNIRPMFYQLLLCSPWRFIAYP